MDFSWAEDQVAFDKSVIRNKGLSEGRGFSASRPPINDCCSISRIHLADAMEEGILVWLDRACTQFRDRNAIEWQGRSLSYGALDVKANKLANCLNSNGLTKGSIVAVLLDDRIEIAVALIGILKAGCVFVPLDTDFPEERLHNIVKQLLPDCFVIAAQSYEKVFKLFADLQKRCRVIALDGPDLPGPFHPNLVPIPASLDTFSSAEPRVGIDPEAICYIYYTSGSTGEPKGIAGRLKGLSHFIKWEIETFNVSPGWRISQFVVPTFDPYLRDVFVPLCAGGTICVPPDKPVNLSAERLIHWIESNGIHLIHCVPTLFAALLAGDLNSGNLGSLQWILLAGEVLHLSSVRRWREIFQDNIKLVNLYGPTETTMAKFFHTVEEYDLKRGFIPIGKPMRGATAYLMDEQGHLCPPGAVGEICICTPYRTAGYYKNPKATADVFIKNPFGDDPDDILYKTGDLGLLLEDGNYRFCGRKDNQVKVRGIRVELEEIESLLQNHPQVNAAAVLAREEAPGDVRLFAYIVFSHETIPTAKELRNFLKKELPDHMIPSVFVRMDSLPLTSTGKVDRKALPLPIEARSELEEPFVSPRSSVEQIIARTWAEILHLDPIGINDNFLELGGHSLLVTRMISRMRDIFQVEVPLVSFFETPTVSGLAKIIELARWAEQNSLSHAKETRESEFGALGPR